jgi:hypothetical protein
VSKNCFAGLTRSLYFRYLIRSTQWLVGLPLKRFLPILARSAGVFAAAFSSFQAGINAVAAVTRLRRGCLLQPAKNYVFAINLDTSAAMYRNHENDLAVKSKFRTVRSFSFKT